MPISPSWAPRVRAWIKRAIFLSRHSVHPHLARHHRKASRRRRAPCRLDSTPRCHTAFALRMARPSWRRSNRFRAALLAAEVPPVFARNSHVTEAAVAARYPREAEDGAWVRLVSAHVALARVAWVRVLVLVWASRRGTCVLQDSIQTGRLACIVFGRPGHKRAGRPVLQASSCAPL